MIPLSKPSYISFADDVVKSVSEVILSGNISQGAKVAEFENMIAEYTGKRHAIAVSSGTSGLFLCLKALGIGVGDDVITTPYSFVASTNVILHCEATPVFVDINKDTYNIDTNLIKSKIKPKTKAILPIEIFGNPVNTNKMQYDNIPIVLDSCESLGSKMNRPFDCAVFAFYANKQITTAEGGMIVTNNNSIADYCRMARNQGRSDGDKWLKHDICGYNYRMSNIHAAIGVEQMKKIEEIRSKRQEVLYQYEKRLTDIVKLQSRTVYIDGINPFVFTVQVDNRDKVMRYLLDNGIECKPYFPAITDMPYMKELGYKTSDYPVCEELASRTLALPFFTDMTVSEVETVCNKLKEALDVC